MTTPTGSVGPADPSPGSAPAAPASRSAVDAAQVQVGDAAHARLVIDRLRAERTPPCRCVHPRGAHVS